MERWNRLHILEEVTIQRNVYQMYFGDWQFLREIIAPRIVGISAWDTVSDWEQFRLTTLFWNQFNFFSNQVEVNISLHHTDCRLRNLPALHLPIYVISVFFRLSASYMVTLFLTQVSLRGHKIRHKNCIRRKKRMINSSRTLLNTARTFCHSYHICIRQGVWRKLEIGVCWILNVSVLCHIVYNIDNMAEYRNFWCWNTDVELIL